MDRFAFGDVTVRYGKTTVGELLDRGYRVSHLEQVVEEPTLAGCRLHRGDQVVAMLCFYSLDRTITLKELEGVPIDLVLPQRGWRAATRKQVEPTPRQQTLHALKRTGCIHLLAALLWAVIVSLPGAMAWISASESNGNSHSLPLGIVLMILPSVLVMFVWAGDVAGRKGRWGKKCLLSLWMICNVALSLCYMGFIYHSLGQ